jgi:hypothetical protein
MWNPQNCRAKHFDIFDRCGALLRLSLKGKLCYAKLFWLVTALWCAANFKVQTLCSVLCKIRKLAHLINPDNDYLHYKDG